MDLKEFADGLRPYISEGKSDAEYVSEIFSNFLADSALTGTNFFDLKPKTLAKFLQDRPLSKKHAQYFYDHRDLDKFGDWIQKQVDASESFSNVEAWLKANGYPGSFPITEVGELLESIVLFSCTKTSSKKQTKKAPLQFEESLGAIKKLQGIISEMAGPEPIPVPGLDMDLEQPYVNELLSAYGEAEEIEQFGIGELDNYPDYAKDLKERRIEYYSAASVERGVMELEIPGKDDQFDVLKREILLGVKNTVKRRYDDGFERMLTVMDQAINMPIQEYILSPSPLWLNSSIRCGVCHYLVNDQQLKWVKKHG